MPTTKAAPRAGSPAQDAAADERPLVLLAAGIVPAPGTAHVLMPAPGVTVAGTVLDGRSGEEHWDLTWLAGDPREHLGDLFLHVEMLVDRTETDPDLLPLVVVHVSDNRWRTPVRDHLATDYHIVNLPAYVVLVHHDDASRFAREQSQDEGEGR